MASPRPLRRPIFAADGVVNFVAMATTKYKMIKRISHAPDIKRVSATISMNRRGLLGLLMSRAALRRDFADFRIHFYDFGDSFHDALPLPRQPMACAKICLPKYDDAVAMRRRLMRWRDIITLAGPPGQSRVTTTCKDAA